MTDTPLWERLPSDTDKSYEAFCIYRDMGSNRSLRDVAQVLDKSLTIIGRWSTAHDWVNRTSDYDDYQDSLRQARNLQRQKEIEDNAYGDYVVLRQAIAKYADDYSSVNFKGVKPYDVSNLASLMKQADDYARRAVGLPDKIANNSTTLSGTVNVNTRELPPLPDSILDKIQPPDEND